MPFDKRIIFPNEVIPVKTYLHTAGRELFGAKDHQIVNACSYTLNLLERYGAHFRDFQFALFALWGDTLNNERVADVFGFTEISDWRSSNPEIKTLAFREYNLEHEFRTCGDSLILFGNEEQNRRHCADLREYIIESNPAGFSGETVYIPKL